MPGVRTIILLLVPFWLAATSPGSAQNPPRHGLWVWKGASIAARPGGIEQLRDFCRSADITETYISVSSHGTMLGGDFPKLIEILHRSRIRVEALLSSTDADQAGAHRDKLLDQVRDVVRFNQKHPNRRFDGIHLDIEPQQRPENKGTANLKFLPGLVDAFRQVRNLSDPAGLELNADIQSKLLKGELSDRRRLLSALPRFTLMLYELSSPGDGQSAPQKAEKLEARSQKFLALAYAGLEEPELGEMMIGLRTPDYGVLLPQMLKAVDTANSSNPHYAGWARHSYNDGLSAGH
jgi:hypothetical protein